jgi:hypothetical protein
LVSPDSSIPIVNADLDYGLQFVSSSASYQVKIAPRTFMKALFNALRFDSLLALQRWKTVDFWHSLQYLDWPVAWLLFSHKIDGSKRSTSFSSSALKAFSTKMMLNELPLLSLLQTRWRPDLYDASWNCILCHEDKETWTHLWLCPVLQPMLLSLLKETKKALETYVFTLLENSDTVTSTTSALSPFAPLSGWDQLDCWRYPSTDSSAFSFDSLIKGFVPCHLTLYLSKFLNKKEASSAIADVISEAKLLFKDHVWSLRCREFALFEESEGISQKMKTSSCPGNFPGSVAPPAAQSSIDRWKSWIARSLAEGKPWLGFLTRINSLI